MEASLDLQPNFLRLRRFGFWRQVLQLETWDLEFA